MADFVAGRGTTALGIIGTALGGLATLGGVNGLTGAMPYNGCNPCGCSESQVVNRYEMGLQRDLSNKDAEIAYLKAQDEVDKKLVSVYTNLDGRINAINNKLCDVAVYQATNTATVSCLSSQVNGLQAVLNNITKTVVPNSSICPGWGDVTITPAAAPTTAG